MYHYRLLNKLGYKKTNKQTKADDKNLFPMFASYCVSYMLSLMFQSTQQFCHKPINIIVLAFVYCVELLLHVSTLLGHHQAIITWICYSLLDCLPIWVQTSDLCNILFKTVSYLSLIWREGVFSFPCSGYNITQNNFTTILQTTTEEWKNVTLYRR
jgi:hypothetical protein